MFDSMIFATIKTQLAATVPFAKHLKIELTEVGSGTATARLPDEKHNANHLGTQHAGALFTLAETASGAAVAGVFKQRILALRPVVKSAHIAYLKSARGSIEARAQVGGDAKALARTVEDHGKAVFAVEVRLTDPSGVTVAEVTVDWHVSKPEKK